MPKDSNGK